MTHSDFHHEAPDQAGKTPPAGLPEACLRVRAELVAWLDGELPEPETIAIRAHLAGCAGCEAERAALDGAWQALELLPGLEPRAGLFAAVEAAARAGAAREAGSLASAPGGVGGAGRLIRFPFAARAAALAAGLLLTAGLGFGLTRVLAPEAPLGPGQLAVQPPTSPAVDPAPLSMDPAVDAASPPEGPQRPGPVEPGPEGPRTKLPANPASNEPGPAEVQVAAAGWQALDPEQRAVVENLDLLLALDEVDDLEVIEAIEVLEEFSDEELGEG